MSKELELKGLKTRRAKVDAERKGVKAELAAIQKRMRDLDNQVKSIDREITKLSVVGTPVVTEHAILRFLERGLGMDMADVKKHILTPEVEALATSGTSGKVPISHGCKAVIKNHNIISVIGGEFQPNRE